jgi:hypothetical protein
VRGPASLSSCQPVGSPSERCAGSPPPNRFWSMPILAVSFDDEHLLRLTAEVRSVRADRPLEVRQDLKADVPHILPRVALPRVPSVLMPREFRLTSRPNQARTTFARWPVAG